MLLFIPVLASQYRCTQATFMFVSTPVCVRICLSLLPSFPPKFLRCFFLYFCNLFYDLCRLHHVLYFWKRNEFIPSILPSLSSLEGFDTSQNEKNKHCYKD
ncbi:hypothetical protein, unlikely [Trypanosoma brucei gambiense DAL972]|uniref:Uncharacterized protein n=1 Tax=Trypanosoma brucei gambiense (strain MHOM/CI/86/DAL972) TaxID=679716 RepID=C9ZT60_TRYB9|nr:hypothetical protein, unlikely [Trypanosoma brucei gambiense DAL972]CBH12595.1 hypothetical protein, unlikely [Trypanosoma brucei gambiense DAL972]|eukprot:XP_011774875.1 hypothetical protein, unlikely [Trypanosoma brucei gambiense DAL972]